MASVLGEDLFETSGQAPAPLKDFYHLQITKTEVIWKWWKISLRTEFQNAKPGEVRQTHGDFLKDSRLQSQVEVVFGTEVLVYCRSLCEGQYDYLPRLPDSLLLNIMIHLNLQDVAQLAHTCHRFKQLCSSEQFWEQTVRTQCDTVTAGMEDLAMEVGWRTVFFTNKLQLQKQISRRKNRNTGSGVSDPSPAFSGTEDCSTEPQNGLK